MTVGRESGVRRNSNIHSATADLKVVAIRRYRLPPLPATDYRLPATDYRLPTTDYRLPTTDYRLPATDYRLPTTDYRLPTTDYRHPASGILKPLHDNFLCLWRIGTR
jgi:hypothetical protein